MQTSDLSDSNQTHYWRPTQRMDTNLYAGDVSQESLFLVQTPEPAHNSSSSVSFSPDRFQPDPHHSPDYTYPSMLETDQAFGGNVDELHVRLSEIEAMLGTDQDYAESFDVSSNWGRNDVNSNSEEYRIMEDIVARGDLKQGLLVCAKAVAENNAVKADLLISMLRPLVSVSGEPIQRLGAYMLEGLVARLSSSGSFIYKGLKCKEPTGGELFSYMLLLYEACPYFKFGYLSANGAIAEATKNEDRIHIIDFQIAQGGQWVTLIQALAARPGGPPSLRITAIDDARNAFARGGGLNIVGQRLKKLAEACKVPFEFNGLVVSGSDIRTEHLQVQPGEALAVNCAFVMHHMPDESVDPQNHRDRLLRLIKSLSPKVVTLVEQEANVNTAKFFHRFQEALSYYSAMFDSIDATLPRDHKDRISVEQHCLAGEIVNILACEGVEREERHEVLAKWKSRFTMAGFSPYPLSSYVNATIKSLLENYCDKYRLEERDGALFLGWMNRDLVSSCAWR
ncbi:putative transcription factor GRAS family [Helianthus annuus]|uniref:Putative transcription factor GRAS n=1 Tax=Helianthus annuus TaxID=4232 RepID=A0A251T9B7_HELAN|nr:scarecrow-like protein 21 [Helianthus annuus]KAF5781177.1 putative transcription factor GRAS family [Helianthus annuus]KAJ0500842.1 putative transcription factor GRAS family [Helianthus annuus]KAJ0508459.1 putative transcription factor GRAS family [Helianthus annuus]KAJ0516715.1 putative transcription factor GRAS family [Helianthus annuus]KAJ0684718.1 putative transcription factor GRAS family [Helianthus annuus]